MGSRVRTFPRPDDTFFDGSDAGSKRPGADLGDDTAPATAGEILRPVGAESYPCDASLDANWRRLLVLEKIVETIKLLPVLAESEAEDYR